ncbi:MAG: hypothetical protein ACYSUF_13150 [Planctomycetota bacterium]|jgi:hypothetical protein
MTDLITELFALHGSAQAAGANAPLPLVDPGAVWLVTQGHVDIVALTITREAGSADLQRTHLLRIPTGQFLFGLHAHPEGGLRVRRRPGGAAAGGEAGHGFHRREVRPRRGGSGRPLDNGHL